MDSRPFFFRVFVCVCMPLYLNTYDKMDSSHLKCSKSQNIWAISLKTRQFVTFDTLAFLMQALIEKKNRNLEAIQFNGACYYLRWFTDCLLFCLDLFFLAPERFFNSTKLAIVWRAARKKFLYLVNIVSFYFVSFRSFVHFFFRLIPKYKWTQFDCACLLRATTCGPLIFIASHWTMCTRKPLVCCVCVCVLFL